jgi:dTDP-4-amino-4,6-dideoxygalactose transaminase
MAEEDLAINGGTPIREDTLPFASPVIGDAEVEEVSNTLRSGWLTTGSQTAEFEDAICSTVGSRAAVGTTNCTSAIYLAHRALGVEGEVITTPMTFATTVSSSIMAEAAPVLADVREDTLTLHPESVKEAITDETEAILPVHYAGQAVDMDAILEIAVDHNLKIIEDAAHGLGGQYEGSALGTLGDAGCYSFYATKSITTSEGGMLVTDDTSLAETARKLRLAGVDKDAWERKDSDQPSWHYDVTAISGKYNMTDIQASIGLVQLERLNEFIETRQGLAAEYDDRLSTIEGIKPLAVRDSSEHARHLYPIFIRTDEIGLSRREFDQRLNSEGIDTSLHYIPIHHHSAFEDINRVGLETINRVAESVLCLPLHPQMTMNDVKDVELAIRKVTTD